MHTTPAIVAMSRPTFLVHAGIAYPSDAAHQDHAHVAVLQSRNLF
jgi:hypothetical protein